jgi:hypothetical protein
MNRLPGWACPDLFCVQVNELIDPGQGALKMRGDVQAKQDEHKASLITVCWRFPAAFLYTTLTSAQNGRDNGVAIRLAMAS